MASTRDIRVEVVAALATVDGLRDSGLIFINRQQSGSTLHRSYTVNVTVSPNSGKDRDRDRIRNKHTFQVQLAHVVKPKDQVDSLNVALDDGDSVVRAVMTYIPLENIARVMYTGTQRALSPSGDFIYSQLTFDAEAELPLY